MTNTLHTHAALIDAIPRALLLERFPVSRAVIFNWRRRGVPGLKWAAFVRLCGDCAVSIPQNVFDEMAGIKETDNA